MGETYIQSTSIILITHRTQSLQALLCLWVEALGATAMVKQELVVAVNGQILIVIFILTKMKLARQPSEWRLWSPCSCNGHCHRTAEVLAAEQAEVLCC